MIKNVISDLGKVVIFFDNQIFFRKIDKYCPYSSSKIAEIVSTNFELIKSFDKGKISPQKFYQEAVRRLKAEIGYDDFYAIYNDVFSINSAVVDVLKRLRPKYRLILLSNTDIVRFDFVRRKFPEILFFDAYVLSYEVGYMKPERQIYQVALERGEAEAKECLFIDDREENIEAAEKIGMSYIHFRPQTDLEAELRKRGLFC